MVMEGVGGLEDEGVEEVEGGGVLEDEVVEMEGVGRV